jgi:hypothetical protein
MLKQISEDYLATVHLMKHPKDIKIYCTSIDKLRTDKNEKNNTSMNQSLNSTND